jgi:hypothetical protein
VEWEGPCGWFILRLARTGSKDRPHDRYEPRLHLAFSAETRERVDAFHRDILLSLRATVLDPPQIWPQYSEGYYAVFFLDPDGIKLEFAHIARAKLDVTTDGNRPGLSRLGSRKMVHRGHAPRPRWRASTQAPSRRNAPLD